MKKQRPFTTFLVVALAFHLQLSLTTHEIFAQSIDAIVPVERTARQVPLVQVLPTADSAASFVIDGQEVTRFHFGASLCRPFLYPVMAHQKVSLTRLGHPHDAQGHSHHNSIWMSHADIGGVNFWADHGPGTGRIVLEQLPPKAFEDGDGDRASFTGKFQWIANDDNRLILSETRKLEVLSLDGARSWLLISTSNFSIPASDDQTLSQSASVTIGPTPFGISAVRMAKTIGVLDGGGRILNSELQVNEKEMFRKPARWCDYTGRIANGADGVGGITLMNSPRNPSSPTPFHVRDDGWMGACLNMETPIDIDRNNPLHLTYGYWVHGWDASPLEIENVWNQFSKLVEDR